LPSVPTPHANVRSKALKVVLNPTVAANVTWNIPDGKDLISIGSDESCNETSTIVSFDLNNVLPFISDPV
jgi:hypothetical protein